MKDLWKQMFALLERYSVVVAGFVIYAYFLLTSINLLEHAKVKRTLIDFVLQFDSLILLWVIAFVIVHLQRYRKLLTAQSASQQKMQGEIEKQRSKLRILDEVTGLVEESLSSPLAVITASAKNIRRRLESDNEARTWIDHIDIAAARVHATINEVKAYETKKIVGESEMLAGPS